MVRQPSIASYVAKFDSAQDLVNEGKIVHYFVDQYLHPRWSVVVVS